MGKEERFKLNLELTKQLIGVVCKYIEEHPSSTWVHDNAEGEEITEEAYLIPKKEVNDFRDMVNSLSNVELVQVLLVK